MQQTHCFLEKGKARTRVCLWTKQLGEDLLICLYNDKVHLGSVAISVFDSKTKRASTSLITLLGHKDDKVAYDAAYSICKKTKKSVCAIAGIHVDNISDKEIQEILINASLVVNEYLDMTLIT